MFTPFLTLLVLLHLIAQPVPQTVRLFDGKTFAGWEGDTLNTWRIEDGALVGGSLTKEVPHNSFLCTTRSFGNFRLRLRFKLVGSKGFINAGIQFHSRRLTNPDYEMTGYQADLGAGFWASLYDESRRNKTLTAPDKAIVGRVLKPNDWNNYEIRTENGHIQLWLNGTQTVDYTEPDKSIPQSGLIGLQIHGGGAAQISYKDILLDELP